MKTLYNSLRFFLVMTLLTGVAYPVSFTFMAEVGAPERSHGTLLRNAKGQVVGSALIGQNFRSAGYFWSRPSAIDYNPMPSGGTNWGPTNRDLAQRVDERRQEGRVADLLFASGSGLDPHISPAAALAQIPRVAKARGMDETRLRALVNPYIEKRQFGFLGEERVNVLRLNLALAGP